MRTEYILNAREFELVTWLVLTASKENMRDKVAKRPVLFNEKYLEELSELIKGRK